MSITAEQVSAGQAIYTKRILQTYDFFVLGISNHFIWNCPTLRLVEHYNENVSSNHLDVGIGTGYFLDTCRFPNEALRLALLDLNQDTLDFASRRIARYRPEAHLGNVLEPVLVDAPKFDSIGLNYLLHCLPGPIESKAVAFDHLKELLNPGGVLFGSTLLHDGVPRGWLAKQLMRIYNRKQIFSNEQDSLDRLEKALRQRFRYVSIEVVGCAAIFSGCA